MSFVQRLIDVEFTLASGTFAESGTNTLEISGLRVFARVVKSGQIRDTLEMDVFGMTESQMKQLSTLGMQVQVQPRNTVTVLAGDEQSGMSKVFSGQMYNTYADFSAMPSVAFRVSAQAVQFQAVAKASPASYAGTTQVADIMQTIAGQLGLAFENNGVTATLANPYFYGSLYTQADACARASGIGWTIDSKSGTLAIWPRNQARNNNSIPVVSKNTGMKGYPAFTAQGVEVTTLWQPYYAIGNKIQVQTNAPVAAPANGIWSVFREKDHLESMVPGGDWFAVLGCYNPAYAAPLPE